jgi:hypothetical protein
MAFDGILSFHCAGSIRVLFHIDQIPGAFVFGVFRASLIMSFNSTRQITSGADIVAFVLLALDYIQVKMHKSERPVICLK